MGMFWTVAYSDGVWREHPMERPHLPEPWMLADVMDSDIATIMYAPVGPGSGTAYLGITPRIYYEDVAASEPTDVEREAIGLANWWWQVNPYLTEDQVRAKAEELKTYLADDTIDEEDLDEEPEHDDDEMLVERKMLKFLNALGLPSLDGE